MELEARNKSAERQKFASYLRTGRASIASLGEIEFKFNPYHDPRNGQFTFKNGVGLQMAEATPSRRTPANVGKAASPRPSPQPRRSTTWGGGGFPGGGGGSSGGAGASGSGFWLTNAEAESFRRRHPGMTPDMVDSGDTLAAVARRHNISQGALARINGLAADAKVKPGDILAVPVAIKQPERLVKPAAPAVAHQRTPAEPTFRHTIKHGYDFAIDTEGRTRSVDGVLTSNPDQLRDKRAQLEAGKPDRLPTDEGGHYIARRFNGPTDAFNHFAQNGNFNRSGYAKLENQWDREKAASHKVRVHIVPVYPKTLNRPEMIEVTFEVDGKISHGNFPNSAGGE